MKHLATFLALIVLVLCPALSFAAGTTFNRIVFFGDSLSDDGNLYHLTLDSVPYSPPYYHGRFSNGPVWSELLSGHYKSLDRVKWRNYAVGGETAVYADHIFKQLPMSLASSVDDYLVHEALVDKSKTLYFIWIGANDYLYNSYDVNERTDEVVAQIQYEIDRLVKHGARNFIIINMPDLSKAPYATENNIVDLLSSATTMHNAKLAVLVAQEQANVKNVNIRLFDMFQLDNTLLTSPETFNQKYNLHITDTTDACYVGSYKPSSPLAYNAIAFANQMHEQTKNLNLNNFDVDAFAQYVATSPDLLEAYKVAQLAASGSQPCSDPDSYVFWDHLHPSAVLHAIIANEMIAFVDQNF